MAANASLSRAKAVQNDEFYTQYSDIEAEINAYIEFNPDVFRDKVCLSIKKSCKRAPKK